MVSPAHNGKFARMNIVASGEKKTLEQIIKQLNKLIDVIHAKDHTGEIVVEKELALIKVNCTSDKRTEILQIAEHFKSQTVDLSESTLMLQVTGSTEKLDAMELMLDKYGIKPTLALDKAIADHYPFLIKEGQKRGAEFIAHGLTRRQIIHTGMSEEEERQYIRASIEA